MKKTLNILSKSFSTQSKLTLSHVYTETEQKPIYKNIPTIFRQITQKFPNRYALHSYDQNVSMTYQQLYNKASKLAAGFKEIGLKQNDRIGLYSYNNYEWNLVQLAASLANLILVNINPAYQSEQLFYSLNKVECKALVTNSKFKSSNYIQILQNMLPQLKTTKTKRIQSSRLPHLKSIIQIDDTKNQWMYNLKDLILNTASKIQIISQPNDAYNIQFTSGTTGQPKACMLSHINVINNAYNLGQRCRYTQKDNICVPVPLFHIFGFVAGNITSLVYGSSVTYPCEGFDVSKTMNAVSKYKCTSLYGVPTMFLEYLRENQKYPNKYDISHLRTGIIGASLCPEILMNRIINQLHLKDITICYGMTQLSPVAFQTLPTDSILKKTRTVGKLLQRLEAKVVNSNGEIVPTGIPGEVLVKGEAVMLGYWQDPENTKKSIVDGFMKTGDLGVMDDDGYLTIVGRIKDIIIRGGQNIYPKQIQDYLRLMKGVLDVQIIGFPDEKYGEEIFALLKLKDGANITHNDIFDHCHKKIAHYKIPRYVKIVNNFTSTVSGKPQKFKMRQQLIEEMKSNKEFKKLYQLKI